MLGAEGGKEPALATCALYLVTRLGAACALLSLCPQSGLVPGMYGCCCINLC